MREAAAPLLTLLILLQHVPAGTGLRRTEEEQRFDGYYNNVDNKDWGSVGSRLYRDSTTANYYDGVYRIDESLPSARAISDLVFKGPSGIRNKRNMTTMLAFFSQVVAYEIMHSTQISCPLEQIKIKVPQCDGVFDKECEGKTEIPFTRAKYDKQTGHGFNAPREQVNERTAWIDASFLYSTQIPWIESMRSFTNGTLKEGAPGYPPLNNPHIPLINPPPPQIHRLMNPERLFILGDSRINENPGLLSFGLVLFRWHNVQARRMQAAHPDWTDEELFQAARRWVIATLQKIVLYDFVPALLGNPNAVPPYTKYMPEIPPTISHAFATCAFRFPHSIVPPAMLLRRRDAKCAFRTEVGGFPALRLCQNWWNAQDIVQEYSVDEIILGMASQIAEAEDNIVVEDLRDYIFGPMHFTRLDVVSSSIMRGRDNGVPNYNALRRSFELPPRSWATINPEMYKSNPELFHNLSALYGDDISRLDAYVGGMLETDGFGPGELFSSIITNQFKRIRDSDRFWFENRLNNIFSDEEISELRNLTLRDIITQTTDIGETHLQEDIFFWKDGDPCPQPFQVNTTGVEECVPFMRFDHFTGNEVTYIFTLIGLGCVPLICIGIAYYLVRRRKKMGWDASFDKLNTSGEEHESKREHTWNAIEWLDENFVRNVHLVLEHGPVLLVKKPRSAESGGLLRRIRFSRNSEVKVTMSEPNSSRTHGPFVVISHDKHYDLVIRMHSDKSAQRLISALGTALREIGSSIRARQARNDALLESAQTKDRRQRKLNHFFREAYSQAFEKPELHDRDAQSTTSSESPIEGHDDVLKTTLTRHEFADAIGMREDALFVKRMFGVVTAKTGGDVMSFEDFLTVIKQFSNGNIEDKMKLIFQMCDVENSGLAPRTELVALLQSLGKAAEINPHKEMLTYDDFVTIFTSQDPTRDLKRRQVGIDLKGAKMKLNIDERASVRSFHVPREQEGRCSAFLRYTNISKLQALIETYRQHIVILFLFTAANILAFLDRFWHYRYETEHRDLRRVMGVGIAITRGAAAALSLDMALVLLTVCRNVITKLRETPIGEYIPFDAAIAFHKIVALTAALFAAIHTIGHCVNFYHVATQSQEGLNCLFPEAVFGSNFLPSISYWFYGTLTGITGIMLVAVMSIIYIFAIPQFMRRAYHAFRLTHLFNIAFYALTFLHGLPRLLDSPKFFYFVIGPIIIFIIDRIMGWRQEYKNLEIISADLLPSDIIHIQFKRPATFKFRSGQWIRISSKNISCPFNEAHAFSMASAPQAPSLELYIKAVGPWTWSLRSEVSEYMSTGLRDSLPKLTLNGPYGDGNQDWRHYEVAVMIGGGIGVTPYASTLMDLVLDKGSGRFNNIRCKKVYFVWICPTHKNYEWFVDVLKAVEDLDENHILETHIYVTQFFHKFDLRTTMLYICEQHFRDESGGASMFTGLRATNHFGRPKFDSFLKFVQNTHPGVNEIGVFSCGPAAVNKQIRLAIATRPPSFIDSRPSNIPYPSHLQSSHLPIDAMLRQSPREHGGPTTAVFLPFFL
ncbi:bli-3 [Pristionchus pacificus]|uniref:NAD(P)H oxidase (H2O2-forming) n=1 Tax=Pristionchus pacificus TaxID=54126 RepID=A0A2A6BIL4_PRIPA|nr:bli-3 [Pristionchus pacificus]|eukprot:PDM65666.1 bli-3 [Pristionchus pacificus]